MTDEQLIKLVARELREDLRSRARHVFIDGNEYVRVTHLGELLASYCHSVNWPPRFRAAISALPSTQADDEAREALEAARGLLCCSRPDLDSTMRKLYGEDDRQRVLNKIDAALAKVKPNE